MNAFRKSIAMLLVAWITIVGHLAVAMPFCPPGDHAVTQQWTHANHAEKSFASEKSQHNQDSQDCAQHQKQSNKKGDIACDACGMCHMACHGVPPVAAGIKSGLPNRVYVAAPLISFISFVPEQPQHIPLPFLA